MTVLQVQSLEEKHDCHKSPKADIPTFWRPLGVGDGFGTEARFEGSNLALGPARASGFWALD